MGDELGGDAEQEQRGHGGDDGEHGGESAGDLRAENVVAFVADDEPDVTQGYDEHGKGERACEAGDCPEIRGVGAVAVGGLAEGVEGDEGEDAAED